MAQFRQGVLERDAPHPTSDGDLIVDPDGPDRARALSSVLVVQAPGLGDLKKMVTAGDYLDKFAKVDGVWRFTERHIGTDLFGDMADHLLRSMPMSEDMRPQHW
ncbi:nuclear transport factor 2 family protein [Gordonia malaquae]